jgi:hypothetical protein
VGYVVRRDDELILELVELPAGPRLRVMLDDRDEVEFAVGDRVTALGRLGCRGAEVVLTRAEWFPPLKSCHDAVVR